MGMSIAGLVFEGYFFAFHLLNIVNNNQLLRGVIQAVTQNGLYNNNDNNNNNSKTTTTYLICFDPITRGNIWKLVKNFFLYV